MEKEYDHFGRVISVVNLVFRGEMIGEGALATVHLATWRHSLKDYEDGGDDGDGGVVGAEGKG